jgi:hypothetical protein
VSNRPFHIDPRDPDRSLQDLTAALNRPVSLERRVTVRLEGQTPQGVGIESHVRANTTTFESWYACGGDNTTTLTTSAWTTNTLIAVPFVGTAYGWDSITFEVTTISGANGKARVGIYGADERTDGRMYPGALLVDGGDQVVSAGTGAKTTTVDYQPDEGRLYFAAYLAGVAAPTVRAIPVGGARAHFGYPVALGTAGQVGYTVASTYAVAGLPQTYPSNATALTGAFPAVFVRHASGAATTRRYPLDAVESDAWVLRRVSLASSTATSRTTIGPYYTISLALRTKTKSGILATFDSRTDQLKAGEPWPLYAPSDDLALSDGDVPEIVVTQYGRPLSDLSGIAAVFTTAYAGSSED